MVDVVLINPTLVGKNPEWSRTEDIKSLRPPLGILSLGSYLEHEGYNVKLMDVTPYASIGSIEYLKELEKIVEQNSPILIGLSVMTAQIVNAYLISRHLKKINPNVPIVWGGIHPTLYPLQTVKDPSVDFVVYGPGEETLLDLIQHLEKGKQDFKEINGLAYENKVNSLRKSMDVNNLPFLNYDLLDIKFYIEFQDHFLFRRNVRMLPMLSSRGCPYRCSFCINSVTKTGWSAQTPKRFLDELEFIVDKYKLDAIRPLDENFFISKTRTDGIIKEFLRRNVDISWGSNIRADCFNENYINVEQAKTLNKIGFEFASMGTESGSDRVLRFIKKDITTNDILSSAKICHESNITPVYSWMIGLPSQTKMEMMDNIKIIKKIRKICPKSIHYPCWIYRPIPGGELYDLCKETGLDEPKSLKEWANPDNLDVSFGSIPLHKYSWIKEKDFVQFVSNYTLQLAGVSPRDLLQHILTVLINKRFRHNLFIYPNFERDFANNLGVLLSRVPKLKKALKSLTSYN